MKPNVTAMSSAAISTALSPVLASSAGILRALSGALLLAGVFGLTGCGGGQDAAEAGTDTVTSARPAGLDTRAPLDNELFGALSRQGGLAAWKMPESTDYNAIPQDPRNPITAAKVKLGQMLYHDPGMGTAPKQALAMSSYSCASCHSARYGFQAGIRQGIGEGGEGLLARKVREGMPLADVDVQPVRSPSAMNGAWQRNMLWNGQFGAAGVNAGTEAQWTTGTPKATNHLGYDGLEIQAIAGQGVHRLGAAPAQYTPLFDAAYPELPADKRYGTEAAGLAIAAYERTLLANRAPWQRWMRGEVTAMSDAQKRGALLFLGKAQCVSCHSGPALNSETFHALGLKDLEGLRVTADLPDHRGRGAFTGNAADNYKFKTPQLYNLADSPFYGHGGSFTSLRDLVVYKNRAVAENTRVPAGQLSPDFHPLGLTDAEIDDLTAFLRDGLHDPDLQRYEPGAVPSGLCVIDEDPLTRRELGLPPLVTR